MPLYEYQCESCEKRFERIQKFSDPPVETCPTCGARVRKLMSSPAIQFKGTGWYITDYARKGSSDGGKGSSSDGKGSAAKDTADSAKGGDSGSSEAKPAPASTPAKTDAS